MEGKKRKEEGEVRIDEERKIQRQRKRKGKLQEE